MKQKVLEYELPIKILPQKKGGFVAICPRWSDCYAQGDSIDEAVLEITAVAQSLIELYREESKKIPLNPGSSKDITNKGLSIPIFISA